MVSKGGKNNLVVFILKLDDWTANRYYLEKDIIGPCSVRRRQIPLGAKPEFLFFYSFLCMARCCSQFDIYHADTKTVNI